MLADRNQGVREAVEQVELVDVPGCPAPLQLSVEREGVFPSAYTRK
jgi:hypothetical protein